MTDSNMNPNTAEFNKKISSYVEGGFVTLGLALGSECGLFDALINMKTPVTATQLAETTQCKVRYVKEWLRMMASGGIIDFSSDVDDEDKDVFYLSPHKHEALSGSVFGCCYPPLLAAPYSKLVRCFKKKGPLGLTEADTMPVFTLWMKCREDFFKGVVRNAIPQIPGIVALLDSGIATLDIGCGNGVFQHHLAARYPNAFFTGIDLSDELIQEARERNRDFSKVQFCVMDAINLSADWTDKFDLVTLVDTLHDLPFPTKTLQEVRRVLKPGGIISVLDINTDSNLEEQAKMPFASLSTYAYSLYYCLSISLNVEGSEGLGTCVGRQKLKAMVEKAGFEEVELMDIVNVPSCFHIIAKNSV